MSHGTDDAPGAAVDVLICDDEPGIRALLREIVEARPEWRVVGEAADGHEAISEAARHQPNVILLDLGMPRLSGLEALAEVGRVAPAAQIVVFTGFSMGTVSDEVLALESVRFLSKGVDPDAVASAIEEAAAAAKMLE